MSEEFQQLVAFRSGDAQPEWMGDGITVRTTVNLDWKDRLRVLIGGQIEVETFTATEGAVGRTETRSCARVPRLLPQKPLGNVEGARHEL